MRMMELGYIMTIFMSLSSRATISQGFLHRPPFAEPHIECIGSDTDALRPLTESKGFPVVRQEASRAPIPSLLLSCCPATVLRRVGAIIVHAVEGVTRRGPWSHVIIEILKRFAPPVTYGDASASVPRVIGGSRFVASVQHMYPRFVLRGAPQAMFAASRSKLCAETPTAFRAAILESEPKHFSLDTTFANATPAPVPVALWGSLPDDGPTSNNLPSEVNCHSSNCTRELLARRK